MAERYVAHGDRELWAIPPQQLEAERSALGSMLIDHSGRSSDVVMDILQPGDFYRDSHRFIFEALVALRTRNEPADLLTVADELTRHDRLDQAGGVEGLTALINGVPTAAHADHYANLVLDASTRRRIIAVGNHLQQWAHEMDVPADTLVDRIESEVHELVRRRKTGDPIALKEAMEAEIARIEAASGRGEEITGIPTGFAVLDRMTSGLQPRDLILMAARPSVGKTALALRMAQRAAETTGPVLVFSVEMSWQQLATRLLSGEARVDSLRLRTGAIVSDTGDEWPHVMRAAGRLSELPIHIDDISMLGPREIRARTRRFISRVGAPALIVVDYIQLLLGDEKGPNRHQELAVISGALKAVAREAGCPILVLSQLSRNVEHRGDRRPQLADLRESGALEADADLVMMLYRASYYEREDTGEPPPLFSKPEAIDVTEILIQKHRNGPTGMVKVGFLKQYARFVELEDG